MPKPSLETTSAKKANKETADLQVYSFPTVGHGITVKAKTREEAEAIAQELDQKYKNLAKQSEEASS